MSFNVEYPSEYYKEVISAKGLVSDQVKVDFTKDKNTKKTPLHLLAEGGNSLEVKRLCNEYPDQVFELLKKYPGIMSNCGTAAVFKLLHNCYHSLNKNYETSHFEDSIGITTGAQLSYHVHRVKSDDESEQSLQSSLTTKGLRNFINNIPWSSGKTLVKGGKDFTPAQENLIYLTDFCSKYYDKDSFFEIGDDGLTPLHELVESDNLGRFIYVVKVFELDNLDKCVDYQGNTLLNWAAQCGCKKILEYLIESEGLSVNDEPNKEGCNTACSIVKNYTLFPVRAQHYVDMVDESGLKDPKFSVLNYASKISKLNFSTIKTMPEKLMKMGTGIKGETYNSVLEANAKAVKALEEKNKAALEKLNAGKK